MNLILGRILYILWNNQWKDNNIRVCFIHCPQTTTTTAAIYIVHYIILGINYNNYIRHIILGTIINVNCITNIDIPTQYLYIINIQIYLLQSLYFRYFNFQARYYRYVEYHKFKMFIVISLKIKISNKSQRLDKVLI